MTVFSIQDGRTSFWQWDLGQRLVVSDDVCCEVHFCNEMDDCALVCEVYSQDGKRVVDVPNILLQTAKPLHVFAYARNEGNDRTIYSEIFTVIARTKPTDYVYTETEVKTWGALDQRIKKLEEGGTGGGDDSNPLIVEITEEADNYTSTHSAEEIYQHMKNVGDVLIYHNGYYFVPTVIDSAEIVFHYFHRKHIEKVTIWHDSIVSVDRIEIDGTPESNLLVVTITGDLFTDVLTSSHTAISIYKHFKNNGNVVAYLEAYDEYVSLNFTDGYIARFYIHQTFDGNVNILEIDEDGNVSYCTIRHASKSDVDKMASDIETALDAILSIQAELIGGDGE